MDTGTVHQQLAIWGRWYVSRHDNGLGFRSHSIEYALQKSGTLIRGTGERGIMINETAERIQKIVDVMEEQQRRVLIVKFTSTLWTDKARADALRMSETTYKLYLRLAVAFVSGALTARGLT